MKREVTIRIEIETEDTPTRIVYLIRDILDRGQQLPGKPLEVECDGLTMNLDPL